MERQHRSIGPRTFTAGIIAVALLAGAPSVVAAAILLWTGHHSPALRWTLPPLLALFWIFTCLSLRRRVEKPLQTLSNLLAALRQGDYSFHVRHPVGKDALAEVMREANAVVDLLREQRLGALEATALLRTVMEEIDVAVFALDGEERVRLVNRAGQRLLAKPAEQLTGATAAELGLQPCLQAEPGRTERILAMPFPGAPDPSGRWAVSLARFRQGGLPMQLLVIADVRRALREEELQAWQRLVRVLGHEINNSLAPIKSMAGSLANLLGRSPRPSDWEQDLECGLRVIGERAGALGRFTGAYAKLAKFPKPCPKPLEVSAWVGRAAALETRIPVRVAAGPEISLYADADQLEQLLINLIRNAVDAVLQTGGNVTVGWMKNGSRLQLWVEDDGPGISNPSNLFVPFFTTKPEGTGIGLVLCRQIAEAHGGTLTLENRAEERGARALLTLPLRL
ncbi:MAG: sensor histidine kinase [Terriglobia bacterium]